MMLFSKPSRSASSRASAAAAAALSVSALALNWAAPPAQAQTPDGSPNPILEAIGGFFGFGDGDDEADDARVEEASAEDEGEEAGADTARLAALALGREDADAEADADANEDAMTDMETRPAPPAADQPALAVGTPKSSRKLTVPPPAAAEALALGGKNYRVSFDVTYQGLTTNLAIQTAMVLPGDSFGIETSAADGAAGAGSLERTDTGFTFTAPEAPGVADIMLRGEGGRLMLLRAFVVTPYDDETQDSLNGFKIGDYEPSRPGNVASFEPTGFIALTEETHDLRVSPHFTLGQFKVKQEPVDGTAYLLIRPTLLLKLEALRGYAAEQGFDADTLHVMSGFRTPWYNENIGNTTKRSRHLYGGAADIWIDTDGDGLIDDLNEDGEINIEDARVLGKWGETLAEERAEEWPAGGIGVYEANSRHGPFVHIDARGHAARW